MMLLYIITYNLKKSKPENSGMLPEEHQAAGRHKLMVAAVSGFVRSRHVNEKERKILLQIAFLGGDRRMTLCAERAKGEGHTVFAAVGGEGILSPAVLTGVREADLLVLPYPATRDGVHIGGTHIPFSALPLREGVTVAGGAIPLDWHREHILFYDLAKDEPFLWQNARLTAEGALSAALTATERGLFGLSAAVLGYGRIGKQLACLLSRMGAAVTVYARRPAALAEAEAAGHAARSLSLPLSVPEELVFSTLPAPAPLSLTLSPAALCYDVGGALPPALSDGQGGEVTVVSMKGVPGVFAPQGAAAVYYDAMRPYLAACQQAGEEGFPEEGVVPTFSPQAAERRTLL